MKNNVDIIVLGATGYTGKSTVKKLAELTKEKYSDVTWGIAGRSKEKLDKLATDMFEAGIKDLAIVECDINDEDSLKTMLEMTKVVINCTGPHVQMSPPIVKACIETGTHYVDISAEMFHILNLYKDFDKTAEDAKVLIIPSCGFDAIPGETGLMYLERHFQGTLDRVECYVEVLLPSYWPKCVVHNGTWTSLVAVLKTFKQHLELKRTLFPKPIAPEPEEMKKSFFHRHDGRTWFPYPGTENDVVDMSQRYLNEKTKKKPIHFKAYTTVQIFFHFIVVPAMYFYYYLSYFKCFRKFLINFPRLTSIGFMSEKGPTDQTRQDTKYRFTLNGKGWGIDDDRNCEPTKCLSVRVSGQDPGYDTTAIAIIMSAITILKDKSDMPVGGVVMPGAAFHKTGIVDRLKQDGYKFEILD